MKEKTLHNGRFLLRMILLIAILQSPLKGNVFGQSFWQLTQEFEGGPKTGIAFINDSVLLVGLTNGIIRSCDEDRTFETDRKVTL